MHPSLSPRNSYFFVCSDLKSFPSRFFDTSCGSHRKNQGININFNRRPHRRSISKTFWRLHDNNACIKHWFRGNFIKQYNKTGYYIRTESTINNPKSLGLQKPVLYLQAYLWEGVECNDRFLECCADVDIASISEGERESYTKPVPDHLGHNVTPPDFRKDRRLPWPRN